MAKRKIQRNAAEKKVLKAFENRAGHVDVGRGSLGAGFLRDLFLGRLGNGKDWEPRRVVIAEAIIPEMLKLDHCEIRHPVCFYDCCFLNGISLESATVPTLDLRGSRVKGKDESGYVFMANGLKAVDVKLIDDFVAEGSMSLGGANIEGELNCGDGRIGGEFFAQSLKAETVRLDRGFIVNGDVKLTGANIAGQLVCTGGKFERNLILGDLTTGSVMLDRNFQAKGLVNLTGANVSAHIFCDGVLEGCCDAQGISFVAVNLKAERLSLMGRFKRVILNGAKIRDQFKCAGGKFEGGLFAQFLKARNAILHEDFNHEVNFLGSNIEGQLDCAGGAFKGGLNLMDAKMGKLLIRRDEDGWPERGALHLDGFDYQRLEGVSGNSAEDGDAGDGVETGLKWLSRMGDDFRPQPYEQLMSVYRRMGHHDWAREVGFELEKRRHRGFKKSKKFLARIREFMNPFWKWLDRFWWNCWNWILNLTIGYGYKPFRSLSWAVVLCLAGVLAFGSAGLRDCGRSLSLKETQALFLGVENRSGCSADLVHPSDGSVLAAGNTIPANYPRFVPVVYAAEALFPVFEFGQLDKWHLGNIWLSLLRWVMTGGGTALLAILALFGVGALGPQRWRGGEGDG